MSGFPKQPSPFYQRVVVPVLCMVPILAVPFWTFTLDYCHDPEPDAPVDPVEEPQEDYTLHCQGSPPEGFNLFVEQAAEATGVNPRLIALTVYRESHCKADALGAVGEIGLGQVYPAIWTEVLTEQGIINSVDDLYDPEVNLHAVGFILGEALRYAKGDPADALRRYNGSGPAAERYSREQSRAYRDKWGEPVWFKSDG